MLANTASTIFLVVRAKPDLLVIVICPSSIATFAVFYLTKLNWMANCS